MDKVFVGIKDNLVVNSVIIDDEKTDVIARIKDEFNYDHLIECDDNQVVPGWGFDGVGVIPFKPYDSWVFNQETRQWEAPTPMPVDYKFYKWDESTISWIEVIPDLPHSV